MSQTTSPQSAAGGVEVPPFARKAVLSIAAVVAVAQFVASFAGRYWFDEVYMLAIGRHHLDWGSADQPPLTPLLAALMDAVAPGSIVALRLPAVLATAAAVMVAALVARELGGDRRAQAMTAGAQATALWITMAGHWLTPYALEPLQWLVLVWVLVRWLRLHDDRLLLALGVVVGIAAETKFQVLLLCAVLLLTVLVFGPRQLLRRPMLWAGAGLGVLIAAPTLVWQARHGWPQLRMGAVVASEAEKLYGGRPEIALSLIFLAGVAGTVLSLYGLWRLLRAEELRSYRFLAVTFLALFVFFVATLGRPYYLGGLYGPLAAVGALGLQRRRDTGGIRGHWVVWPAFVLSAAVAGGMLVVGSTATNKSGDRGDTIARRTAAAYHALPDQDRQRTAIMGGSYIIAAYIDGYSTQYDLPRSHSSNRGYGYFPPPPETQDQVLYIGPNPDELRPHFTNVRKIAEGGPDTPEASVWLCTGKHELWASLWPHLRNLSVS
ncbi:glycosyltransferase family 39 protein [Amycolatopsis anabasis]|uniref:glycosyltransferase family 39 protein n=1 Tax=Amycolatopsis anabasis TaxID=1840409 RepID=UPI00131AB6FD|nr:glycosyltransferase family 39 protein [Amycolatopsis anabasis]